jgi:hypothetical protein
VRKCGSIVCKWHPCLPKGPTDSAHVHSIVTAVLHQQYFWIRLVYHCTAAHIKLSVFTCCCWLATSPQLTHCFAGPHYIALGGTALKTPFSMVFLLLCVYSMPSDGAPLKLWDCVYFSIAYQQMTSLLKLFGHVTICCSLIQWSGFLQWDREITWLAGKLQCSNWINRPESIYIVAAVLIIVWVFPKINCIYK